MDCRDVAAHKGKWYQSLDEKRMIATAEVWDEDGDEVEVDVHFKWELCPLCRGKGRHVNPSIDADHGITQEEFDRDPGFMEDYLHGVYDVQCYECDGMRVVPMPDESTDNGKKVIEKMEEQARWAADEAYAARMGY